MSREAELIDEVRQALDNLEASLRDKRAKLEDTKKYILDAKQDLKDIEEQVESALTEQQLTIERLEKAIKPLKSEEQRLKGELEILVTKKGELTAANIQLDQKNKDFEVYTEQAWKVLNAKDEALIKREEDLQQRENLKPSNKSFLPTQ